MADEKNDWLLAVSKEEIDEKLTSLAKEHSALNGKLIKADSNKTKLKNAVSAYAHLEQGEEAVILYDDTLFGGAKEGFVVTNKNVYMHNLLCNPEKVPIGSITKLGLVGNDIVFNMSKATMTGLSSATRKDVASFLQGIIFKKANGNTGDTKSEIKASIPPAQPEQKPAAKAKTAPQKTTSTKKSAAAKKDVACETAEKKTPAKKSAATSGTGTASKKTPKAKEYDSSKYFQSESFQGFLYDDFGIGAYGSIKDIGRKLQKQLQQQGGILIDDIEYQVEFVEEKLYIEFVNDCSSIKVCELPVSEQCGIGLLTDYENDSHLGSWVSFAYSNKAEFDRIFNKVDYVLAKYNFKLDKESKEYMDAADMMFYSLPKPEWDMYGKLINYQNYGDSCKYVCIVISLDSVIVISLFGEFARDAMISLAKEDWKESICLNTEDYAPEIHYYGDNDNDEDTFNKLLDKWDDILSRDDAKGKVVVTEGNSPDVAFEYKSENSAVLRFKLEYEGAGYSDKDVISLEFQKGANKMECSANIHFSTSDIDKKECLYSLQSVLAHLGKA